jgi:hypothetical protein
VCRRRCGGAEEDAIVTKVDRAWFVKGASLIAVERDFSKSFDGVDRDVRWTVLGTRHMANGVLRVKMQHEHGWGFTLVVPPGDEVKVRIRPST